MSTSEGKGITPMRMPAIRNSLMAYGHHQEFVQKDVMYLNRSTEELAKEDMFVRPVAECVVEHSIFCSYALTSASKLASLLF